MGLVGWLVVGLVVGAVARLLVPGRQPMGCLGTIALGVAGSFVGGALGNLISGRDLRLRPTGLLGSVIGAVIVLLILRAVAGRRRR